MFLGDCSNLLDGALTILHLAPEYGIGAKLRRLPRCHYVTADLDPSRASIGLDAQAMPFHDASFDCVLCSHVLEHIPDDRRAMKEMLRILRPGGWAVLQVPLDCRRAETLEDKSVATPEARECVFGQHDHVRVYGRDYARRLADAGFAVRFHDCIKQLPPATILKYGLSTEPICVVTRPLSPPHHCPQGVAHGKEEFGAIASD